MGQRATGISHDTQDYESHLSILSLMEMHLRLEIKEVQEQTACKVEWENKLDDEYKTQTFCLC